MATISKRGDSYRIKVSCGYDTSGKQVVQSMTWKPESNMTAKQIEKEVNRQAVLFEEACLKGQVISTIKFEDFAEQWFNEYAERNLKKSTVINYKWLRTRVYKAIGHLRLDKVTPRHIQKFINELSGGERKDNRGADGLSPKTVKLHISLISTIFDYAMKMQMISQNPCRMVSLPKPKSKEREVYTLEEAQQILELLEQEDEVNLHYVVFFTMAIYTGFRRGELLGLEWSDFDFDSSTVTIKRSFNTSAENGIYTDTPKTASSARTLKLSSELVVLILRYKDHQSKIINDLGDKWIDHNRLFTKWNGEPMYPNTPYRFFTKFCKRNGLRQLNVHSLRHFTASVLINSGVDVKTVQSCLGHSSPTTTLNIYSHSFQAAQARAMDAVADVINFKKSKSEDRI